MDAKELRIGNLVYSKSCNCNFPKGVIEINFEAFRKIHLFDGLSGLEPIPLTEEWLLKFGFGKSDEFEMGHNENFNFGFYYDYHFNRFMLDCDNENDEVYIYLDHIKHVHQLQNLYFALTNEELKEIEK